MLALPLMTQDAVPLLTGRHRVILVLAFPSPGNPHFGPNGSGQGGAGWVEGGAAVGGGMQASI